MIEFEFGFKVPRSNNTHGPGKKIFDSFSMQFSNNGFITQVEQNHPENFSYKKIIDNSHYENNDSNIFFKKNSFCLQNMY